MNTFTKYSNLEIISVTYENFREKLPENNWLCIAITNNDPNRDNFEEFVRLSVSKNILEFKTQGFFCEKLHDWFDEITNIMEVMENHVEIDIITTWHNNQTISNVLWQSLFANCLPKTTDFKNLKLVCFDLDGENRIDELKQALQKIERGWSP
jgi:hypothetical protein